MTANRIDDDVSEAVLGHVKGGISGRYDHASLIDEQRAALEGYAEAILEQAVRFETVDSDRFAIRLSERSIRIAAEICWNWSV